MPFVPLNTNNSDLANYNNVNNALRDLNNKKIKNADLSTTPGDIGGAWKSWTPTWTNLTVGNAVQNFKYTQIGKTIHIRGYITLGSTSSMGTGPTFTLPVTAKDTNKGTATGVSPFGSIKIEDNTTTNMIGGLYFNSTTVAVPNVYSASGSYVTDAQISATVPMTWVSGDELRVIGTYEAA